MPNALNTIYFYKMQNTGKDLYQKQDIIYFKKINHFLIIYSIL